MAACYIFFYILIELTSSNVLRLLVKSGFAVERKWIELTRFLHVAVEEERRLQAIASSDQNFHFALEEGLKWWITNSTSPSWEELITAIEACGDKPIAVKIRRELSSNEEGM